MTRYGGCGLIPSGAYHQEWPTTIEDRRVDAPQVLRGLGSTPPRVSVLMPTFNQAAFLRRALDSLLAQTFAAWELVIVDDGSTDGTRDVLGPFLGDARIRYYRHHRNRGLGAALNAALDRSRAPLIAYLPSDDVYHTDHLASLVERLEAEPDAVLAYSGVRYHYNRFTLGQIDGEPLQLVQVLHRRTEDRWVEREELVTDDLDRMFWSKLRARGGFVGTGRVSCEWVEHPAQRHRVIREPLGGINPYRVRYGVERPLRFHSSVGHRIDEVELYRRYRERPDTPMAQDGLKILLVGDLSYFPERILALEERGHRLYGLWTDEPHWYTSVGPLPFGHVEDLPRSAWREALRRIKPDIIYALLNWQSVPFAHQVLMGNPGIPFVWHFKEGPFICLRRGTWPQLIDLLTRSDGLIFANPELRAWYATVIPGIDDPDRTLVLDGDLPKRDWFASVRSPRLSEADGQIHTVAVGRPIGLHPPVVSELARQGIHLHFYGDYIHGQWRDWIEEVQRRAPGYLHLHPHIDPDRWVAEFSQYDAGWLHVFESKNGGDLRRADWDDLNIPSRSTILAAAGVPMLQRENRSSIVAAQSLVRRLDLGLFFNSTEELAAQLRDGLRMARLRENIWRLRDEFTFDHHADRLIAFFRRLIAGRHVVPAADAIMAEPTIPIAG
ncbi:MAG: glycosyltransferase [Isosphaeraceae bacterium]|nr:glycosyltransferase [Isosphaeraceae bacterium]